LVHFPQIPHL